MKNKKNKNASPSKNYEREYNSLMKGCIKGSDSIGFMKQTEWAAPGDYFVKLSLYNETQTSISSINTIVE